MNKTAFFMIAGLLAVVIVFLLISIMAVQERKEDITNPKPTITPTPTPTLILNAAPSTKPTVTPGAVLAVTAVEPVDGATNVPIHNSVISITFNQEFRLADFIFALTPDVDYLFEVPKIGTAVIKFTEPLEPNTVYTYRINTLKQLPRTFTFTTGPASGSAELQSPTP